MKLFSGAPPPTASELFGDDDQDGARWYQREAYEAILESLKEHQSCLVVQATGLGKTYLFSMLAKHWKGRVLVLAHRDELIRQSADSLERICGEPVEIEQAELRATKHARLVVGSVQSVYRQHRLDRIGEFDLVIVDEAHHVTAKSYLKILEQCGLAKVVGFTATPDRSDERALAQVFSDVAHCFDIQDGVEAGFLVPVRAQVVEVEEIDISHVKKSKGEGGLNLGQLDDAILEAVEGVVKETLRLEPGRRGICFFPGVHSAQLACERFNAERPGSACFISGTTPADERRQKVTAFREGRFHYLCNCAIATEGFDAPGADLIVLARPTLSRSLNAQMIGRGTRVLPGLVDRYPGQSEDWIRRDLIAKSPKPDLMILDFVGNCGKHTLATPVDVLGGNYSQEEVERAKKKVKENPRGDVSKALKKARAELNALREQAKNVKSKVKSRVRVFDPFSVFHMDQDKIAARDARFGWCPPTQKQLDMLKRAGVTDDQLKNVSKHGASRLISTIIMRRTKKLANLKQLKILKKFGVDNLNVTFDQASRGIDVISRAGWGQRGGVPVEMITNAMGLR